MGYGGFCELGQQRCNCCLLPVGLCEDRLECTCTNVLLTSCIESTHNVCCRAFLIFSLKRLHFLLEGSTAYTQSEFGKSDKTVHLSNVKCKGSEKSMQKCTKEKISLDEGEKLFKWIDVAGVSCNSTLRPTATLGPMTATANNSWTVPSTTKKSSSSSSLLPFASVVPILNHHIQQNGMTIGVSLFFVVLVIVAIAVVTG